MFARSEPWFIGPIKVAKIGLDDEAEFQREIQSSLFQPPLRKVKLRKAFATTYFQPVARDLVVEAHMQLFYTCVCSV